MSTHATPAPGAREAGEPARPVKVVKWGVVGSGGIARRRTIPEGFAGAANAGLVGVCGRDPQANAALAEGWGVAAADSLEALLAMDLDAVYIASPPDAHREQTLACARAGRHVLCEKPLAVRVADAEAMQSGCERAGVRLGTALMMRFHAQHRAALDLLRAGRLGRPVFARAQLSCWYPPIAGAWRQDRARGGGGALMDLGGHCIDLLEMFFGPARSVSCAANQIVHSYPVEDGAVVTLQFADAALGVVDTFFCMPDEASRNRLELYGSHGSILAEGTIGQGAGGQMIARLGGGAAGYDAQQERPAGEGAVIAPPPVNLYRAEIEEFSQAILEDREPANHGRLGVRSQRVLAACYESAASGRTIMLPP